jgi:hypothetical protein
VTYPASPGNDDRTAHRFKEEPTLATPNYSFEKRQRELAKKRKAEEKRQRKQGSPRPDDSPEPDAQAAASGSAGAVPTDPTAKPAP